MRPISERAARQALAAAHSRACDPGVYTAVREQGGWAFRWAGPGPSPLGVRTQVVTDSGIAGRVGLGESAAQAIGRLARPARERAAQAGEQP